MNRDRKQNRNRSQAWHASFLQVNRVLLARGLATASSSSAARQTAVSRRPILKLENPRREP